MNVFRHFQQFAEISKNPFPIGISGIFCAQAFARSFVGARRVCTVTAQPPFSAGLHIQPQYDVVDALPSAAAEKLRLLRQRSADAHALIPEFADIQSASMARVEAEQTLKRLTNHPQDGGFNLPETDQRVVAAKKHLDKMTADFKRQTELQERRTAEWQATSGAVATCDDLLRHGVPGNCQIDPAEVEPPKLNKGETVVDAIERCAVAVAS